MFLYWLRKHTLIYIKSVPEELHNIQYKGAYNFSKMDVHVRYQCVTSSKRIQPKLSSIHTHETWVQQLEKVIIRVFTGFKRRISEKQNQHKKLERFLSIDNIHRIPSGSGERAVHAEWCPICHSDSSLTRFIQMVRKQLIFCSRC